MAHYYVARDLVVVGWVALLVFLPWCWWWAGWHWSVTQNLGGVSRFEANRGAHQNRSACWGREIKIAALVGATVVEIADPAVVLVVGWVALECHSESGRCEQI